MGFLNSTKEINLKRAFTIVELVFIIVILGILAVVIVPKLAATKTDAQISKFTIDLTVYITEIAAYYTAKGELADIKEMSHSITDTNGKIKIGNVECAQIVASYALASEADASRGIVEGTPIVKIIPLNGSDAVCGSAHRVAKRIIDLSPVNVGHNNIKFN